ncbi:MAG: DUF427 domain-containing protein [Ectothiorhodospiraceae bacterium]|nr:DUF427 domain-containing protein [Ectothiorhodospiraceae bacterium]
MRAIWKDVVLAESDETIVIENNHYFPPSSVNVELLSESNKTTECSWKGTANYYTVIINGEKNSDAAWYYRSPKPAAEEITNYVAFWKGIEVSE